MKKTLSAIGLLFAVWAPSVMAEDSKQPVRAPQSYAFLFGESIEEELEPGQEAGFGIHASHVDWWVGNPDGTKLRRLDDPKTGRLRVRPVDRTVILKRDDTSLTLLGPDGADLTLSLEDGPLAKTELHDLFYTTYSFTRDGKSVVFVNKQGAICRFVIGARDLIIVDNSGVDPGTGIRFSRDGTRMLYSKYSRENDFVPTVFSIYVANVDGTGEKKLTEYKDGEQLGSGFLPDGRVGVVDFTTIRAYHPTTGTAETVAGPWKKPIQFRAFGGFNPDGSTFIYDLGGPYELRLFAFDVTTSKLTTVKKRYLESFQQMVWVQVTPADQ